MPTKRLGISFVVAAFVIFGCVQNPIPADTTDDTNDINANDSTTVRIPAGDYAGTITRIITYVVDNASASEDTASFVDTVSFDNNGIPLDFVGGQPETVGLSTTVDFDGITGTETTQSVVLNDGRVTVTYAVTYTVSDFAGEDSVSLSGTSTIVYSLNDDGTVTMSGNLSVSSDAIDGVGVVTLVVTNQGTLSR